MKKYLGPKQFKPQAIVVDKFISSVEQYTGGPPYEKVAELLQAVFVATVGASKQVPKTFNTTALKQLHARGAIGPSGKRISHPKPRDLRK